MKKEIFLFISIYVLFISCRAEYESVCYDDSRQTQEIKVPFLALDSLIIFITSDYYEKQNKVDLPLNNLLIYNYITDSITLKKTNLIGTPLKIFKNKNEAVVLITSKCIYTIDKEFKFKLENQFNFGNENNKFKTLYDWVDDNLIIMPGIDNQDRNIYKINTLDFSYELFDNSQLTLYKNELVDFIFPKSLNNIDFIFSNGSKYFIVKDENIVEKSLPNNNKIFSLSFNYFDNEICLGSDNGSVYYDDFTEIRKNILKNGVEFPDFLCNDEKVTAINFENNFFVIFQNNNIFTSHHFSHINNKIELSVLGNYKNIEEVIIPINNKKDEIEGYSTLILNNNEILFSFSGNAYPLIVNNIEGKILPNFKINYNKKTLEIYSSGGHNIIKTKNINYVE